MFLRFSRNSEALASEFLENLENMFPQYHMHSDVEFCWISQPHTIMLPLAKYRRGELICMKKKMQKDADLQKDVENCRMHYVSLLKTGDCYDTVHSASRSLLPVQSKHFFKLFHPCWVVCVSCSNHKSHFIVLDALRTLMKCIIITLSQEVVGLYIFIKCDI